MIIEGRISYWHGCLINPINITWVFLTVTIDGKKSVVELNEKYLLPDDNKEAAF